MMTHDQIKAILKNRYNRGEWKNFIAETFKSAELFSKPQQFTDFDTQIAQEVWALGIITLPESENDIERKIAIYEVKLTDGVVLERNRVGLRNLLYKYWKNIDGAFIVYTDNKSTKWRFTYVSELTGFDEDGECTTIKTEPKRYTYVLGENEKVKTAVERFLNLAKKDKKINLNDIKEAFSVEKLSDIFFDEYKKHYNIFCKYLFESPDIEEYFPEKDRDKEIRDFTKKLLGRIVFLYFIQKKGWLGVPLNEDYGKGDFKFLRNEFDNFKNADLFYQQFLAPLFFDTLNKKRENDVFEPKPSVKIPYLNGGLFEEENPKYRKILIGGKLFAGLFEFFDQYNFTIYEDDPNDQTVAIDPEMLGHIFENLLEDNKDKGAYYTPKEIVHYMCQESLIEYLKTYLQENKHWDEHTTQKREADLQNFVRHKNGGDVTNDYCAILAKALKEVKICDPAIGSGAFPMGVLTEIYSCVQTLYNVGFDEVGDIWGMDGWRPDTVKKNIIQNSIYGVDIEKGAVDIARLRFWLSLVIDEPEPKPLPNLDYKIVVGNSLISKFDDEVVYIQWDKKTSAGKGNELLQKLQDSMKELVKKQKEYFEAISKEKLKTEIRNLKIDILLAQIALDREQYASKNIIKQAMAGITLTAKEHKANIEIELKLTSYDNILKKLKKLKEQPDKPLHFFDWKLDFPEIMNEQINTKTGFDIIIGNPPYIQLQKDNGKLATMYQKESFDTFEKTGDIYCLFYEKGWHLLKQKATLNFITSNKWMRAGYGETLREFFINKTNPLLLVDFAGTKIFEGATVDTNILLYSKDKNQMQTKSCVFKGTNLDSLSLYINQNIILNEFNSKTSWVILSPIEKSIKEKIERIGTPLKDWDIQINYGIKTGFNEAFIINGTTKDKLIKEDPNSADIIRPILRGRDIKRYGYEFADLWLINTHNGIKEKGIKPVNIDDYPAIKKYLNLFYSELKNRADKGDTPYNLRNCAYMDDFSKQKIVWKIIGSNINFLIENKGFFYNNAANILTSKSINLSNLIIFLNSRLFEWYFKKIIFIEVEGGGIQMFNTVMECVPILKNLTYETELKIENLLQNKDYENIDKLVYELYELNKQEIDFIVSQ